MMRKDNVYTNGVIAVKETRLLKEKLTRMCELSAEDAFRLLTESGFGGGAESSVYDFEKLVERDEREIDEFILEYASSEAEFCYLLSPRDFHNAKALVKANYLGADAEKMLAPAGRIPVSEMAVKLSEGDYAFLGKELGGAVEESAALLKEGKADGAAIGGIFERALSRHLFEACSKNRLLKGLLSRKADMTNLLTAFRSKDEKTAQNAYLDGGALSRETLALVFCADEERAERALGAAPYAEFAEACFEARRAGKPFTRAEKMLSSLEIDYFSQRRYELKNSRPFLYYVYRRRIENENVRIVFVCLLAGMKEQEIKARLRG